MAPGSTAQVVAEKHGRRSDFDRIDIRVEQESDGFTICAVYSRNAGAGCDRRTSRNSDRDDYRDIRASVDFEVQLPAGAEFIGTSVTGDVRARDGESNGTAKT